jgi:predicted nucleotidyltransferase
MKSLAEIKSIIELHKAELAEKYGVAEIGVFGSVVRGEARDDSDVDVLVEFNRPVGFFGLMDLEFFLEELLDVKKIDLVTRGALKPRIGRQILSEVVMI